MDHNIYDKLTMFDNEKDNNNDNDGDNFILINNEMQSLFRKDLGFYGTRKGLH